MLLLMLSLSIHAKDEKKNKEKDKQEQPVKMKTLLKEARNAIKNNRDQSKAEQNLQKALERPEFTDAERAEACFTMALLRENMNASENMKAYLKQKYDTVQLFNTVLGIYQHIIDCDSFDTRCPKPVFRNKGREMLLKHRKNLLQGGKFLLQRNKNKEAYPFFRMYLRSMNEPLLANVPSVMDEPDYYRIHYWATLAAYNGQLHREFLEHVDTAFNSEQRDSTRIALLEYKSVNYGAMGDSVAQAEVWKQGLALYPAHDFFFKNLFDYYQITEEYNAGIQMCDTLLRRVGDRSTYWYGKALMYFNKHEYEPCAEMCDSVISREPEFQYTYYYKSMCFLNLANDFTRKASTDMRAPNYKSDREKLRNYYENARGPMEQYRKMMPDDKKRWGAPLYQIYLNLNMGEAFDEIEKLLEQ